MNLAPYGALGLAAWRGREREARDLIEAAMGDVVSRGEGIGVTNTQWAKALLLNGLGRFPEAVVAARQAAEQPHELGLGELGPERARRGGRPERAARAGGRRARAARRVMTNAAGTDWALGTEARSHALLSDGDAAERALSRGDRAARQHPRRASSSPAPVCSTANGCARAPAARRARAAAHRARDVRGDGRGSVRRARRARAAGDR